MSSSTRWRCSYQNHSLYTTDRSVQHGLSQAEVIHGWLLCRPEGALYQMFRSQFLTYCLYQSKRPLLVHMDQQYVCVQESCGLDHLFDSFCFLSFRCKVGFVQFLQYYYQSGCLYRLRALGERHNMDLTVGGYTLCVMCHSSCIVEASFTFAHV